MDAPTPMFLKPNLKPIETIETIEKENNIADFSLNYNKMDYQCSLYNVNDSRLKFILKPHDNSLITYQNELDFSQFQELNRNFRIYENLKELGNDLISYIKQNQLIIDKQDNNLITLKLSLVAKKENIVIFNLNKKELPDKEKFKIIFEELKVKNKEIEELRNKLKNIEEKNRGTKEPRNNLNNIEEKNKEIEELRNKLNNIEKKNDEKINTLEKKIEDLKKFIVNNINNKKNEIVNYDSHKFLTAVSGNEINFTNIDKEKISIERDNSINDLCFFPETGNFIESSGPSIFDKNYKFVKTFTEIGFCEHVSVITNNLVVMSQKQNILVLYLLDIENNNYIYEKFNKSHKYVIKKIIKGQNQNTIITSDAKGNIKIWDIIIKSNKLKLNTIQSITIPIEVITYVLLVKNILIAGAENLFFYEIQNSKVTNVKTPKTLDVNPLCWNCMIIIDEAEQKIAVGSQGCTYILKISNEIIKEKELKYEESSSHEALCLYKKSYLLVGCRKGDIYIFDINNDYKLIKTIKMAHNQINDYSINGITELSDNSFASFGEDKKIKIWS